MPAYPKLTPYRNQALRDLAEHVGDCMFCGSEMNSGSIVLAHSNRQVDGKGMGLKSADVPCYLCPSCHNQADGRTTFPRMTPEQRDHIIDRGAYRSFLWFLENGDQKLLAQYIKSILTNIQ